MSAELVFYIGRAGTGKSRAVYAALSQGRGAALFVPEQFTYEAERALSHVRGGLPGVQVLSISRLSERIIRAQDKPFLSSHGRRMVVRRAAYRLRNRLTVFADAAARPGFAARVNDMLAAFKQARLQPEDLRLAAGKLRSENMQLALKLEDLALLYEDVQGYLSEQFIDHEDALDAVLKSLPTSQYAGVDIVFDGFDAVNEQLYAILELLLGIARRVTVTLCLDPDPDARDAPLFETERGVYLRLREMGAALGCTMRERHFTGFAPHKAPELVRLERELFALNPRPMEGDAAAILLTGARDRTAEVDALADLVHAAAREGVRYRDMAVIAADMAAYAPLVQRAFAQRDIPLFLDARRSMQGHPVVELVLCALRAAAAGFHRPELNRVLKTGLAGVEQGDAEAFENYALARGLIAGKAFLHPFPEEEAAAERARAALMGPLQALREGLRQRAAGDKARAVYAYLEALCVQEQLHREAERLRAEGRYALMEEHAQVWGILLELLEQFHFILGANEMTAREFIEVLTEAMNAYQVGVIPATADQVLLGDFHRTRSREVRALFLLGCNEGVLLSPYQDQEMIDDEELSALKGAGAAIWAGTRERGQADRLSLYRALTKATEHLCFSFAYADGAKELIPAGIIDDVKRLFPALRERAVETSLPENEKSGFARLTARLSEPGVLTEALRRYYRGREPYRARLITAEGFAATPHVPSALGAPVARRLYGGRYFGSVSRLETFRACPYQYFLQYGLGLKPRREFREKTSDVGSFSHRVLERFLSEVMTQGLSFSTMTREEALALLARVYPACLEEYESGLLVATPRARALSAFYLQALQDTVWAMVKSIRCGSFEPMAGELRFGAGGSLPAIELGNGSVQLAGVIDRVDRAYDEEGAAHVRVVDYKSGEHTLRFDAIYDGLALQLPLYLSAIEKLGRLDGMYYQPVMAPIVEEGEEGTAMDSLRLSGFTRSEEGAIHLTEHTLEGRSEAVKGLGRNKDQSLRKTAPVLEERELHALLAFARLRAERIAGELLAGKIEARPVAMGRSSACAYCDYKSVCRFDARLPDCRVRSLRKISREDFFEEAQKNGAHHKEPPGEPDGL